MQSMYFRRNVVTRQDNRESSTSSTVAATGSVRPGGLASPLALEVLKVSLTRRQRIARLFSFPSCATRLVPNWLNQAWPSPLMGKTRIACRFPLMSTSTGMAVRPGMHIPEWTSCATCTEGFELSSRRTERDTMTSSGETSLQTRSLASCKRTSLGTSSTVRS